MKQYAYVIFDADHTLLDFNADEKRALRAAFAEAGVKADEKTIRHLFEYSAHNWSDLGLNEVDNTDVQAQYHSLYYEHVKALFDYIEKTYALKKRAAAEAKFMKSLSLPSVPIDGAFEIVTLLQNKYKICVATNGLSKMQRARLSLFAPMLHAIFVSEEMGLVKPNPDFFKKMLSDLGTDASKCLMVGDSFTSDVAGAKSVGMDCVLFNPYRLEIPASQTEGVRVIYRLNELTDLI